MGRPKKNKPVSGAVDIAFEQLSNFAVKGAKAQPTDYIPTGHFSLDFALNFGVLPGSKDLSQIEGYDSKISYGVPLGYVAEIYGNEGSGKSSLCYRMVGGAQKKDYPCMWFDLEQSFSESLALINGVDLDNLYLCSTPDTAENHLDNMIKAIKAGIKFIVVDSVAALIPKEQLEGDAGDQQMALLARIMSRNIPKIVATCGEHNATIIFINQIREKPGVMFGPNTTTPGGNALKFYASIRLNLTRRDSAKNAIFIEDPGDSSDPLFIGRHSGLKIDKNRFGKPVVDNDGKSVMLDIPIFYEKYFPDIEEVAFDVGRQLQLIRVRKGVYYWDDFKEEGRQNFIDAIMDGNKLTNLIAEIKSEAMSENKSVVLPPELAFYDPDNMPKRIKKDDVNDDEDIPKKDE